MSWKLEGEGDDQKIVLLDGKPVFVHADGKETAFDGEQALKKIADLQRESKTNREAKEAAEAALEPYKTLGEIPAVTELIERAKLVDAKKLIDSGKVEDFKKEWEVSWKTKLEEAEKKAGALERELFNAKVGERFTTSDFVKDRLMIGPVSARTQFGDHFKLENGVAVGYASDGTRINSRDRFGEAASFEEALEQIVAAHPERDRLLRDHAGSGAGTKPSQAAAQVETKPAPTTSLQIDFSKRDTATGPKPEDILTSIFSKSMEKNFADNPELLKH